MVNAPNLKAKTIGHPKSSAARALSLRDLDVDWQILVLKYLSLEDLSAVWAAEPALIARYVYCFERYHAARITINGSKEFVQMLPYFEPLMRSIDMDNRTRDDSLSGFECL